MPVVKSLFHPPWYLRNPHVQTFRRERLELPDGDFLDLDWIESGHGRLVILCSGLEGNSRDPGMLRLARSFAAYGWDVLSWNYRGCSGVLNRLVRSYHSGATEDLETIVAHAGGRSIALVGCSIGGNLVLKYLGEAPPPANVIGAAAISAPVDLASTARALDRRPGNRIYLRRHGFEHFDERYTAPTHGFLNAEDYWEKCSARQFLPAIAVPTLFLSAKDDPFLTPEAFPYSEASTNPPLTLEVPEYGGHLGFLDARGPWTGHRIPEFLSRFAP